MRNTIFRPGAPRDETDGFDEEQYLANYQDLQDAFGNDGDRATLHYIQIGKSEGRTDDEPGNNPPLAFNDIFEATEDGGGIRLGVLANDTDPDAGDALAVVAVSIAGTKGSVALTRGRVSYDPEDAFDSLNADQTATDTFRYTITDGAGGESTATVTIEITGVDDPPPANEPPAFTSDAEPTVDENTTAVVTLAATDPEGAPVTFALSGGEDQDLFTVTGAELAFTAAPDFEAPGDADDDNVYLVQVTATDAAGGATTQDLTVTVANDPADDPPPPPPPPPPNEPPAFTSDAEPTVDENTTAVVTLAATDPEGDRRPSP